MTIFCSLMTSHFPIFHLGAQFLSLFGFMALLLNLSGRIVLVAECGESLGSGRQSQKKLATKYKFFKGSFLFLNFVQIWIPPP